MLKDKVPLINSNQDPLYSQKLDLLLYGHESLNHSTYQEWSKEVEVRFSSKLGQLETNEYSLLKTQEDCLALSIFIIIGDHLGIENWNKGDHLRQITTGFNAIRHVIAALASFSSEDLLKVLDSNSIDDGKASYEQVTKCIQLIEKHYLPALEGIFEENITPLLSLCEQTFATLLHAKWASTVMAKSAQPTIAALKRHEPSIKTKEYAISLYEKKDEGKEWDSKVDAARKIHKRVVEYGETVNWCWNYDDQAHDLIYRWIIIHTKNS